MAIILVCILGTYAVVDTLSLGLGAEQRAAYAVLFCITILLMFVTRSRSPRPQSLGRVIGVWWLIGIIGFLMVLTQETIYPVYVVGDAASFLYPALLLLIARKDATAFRHVPTICIAAALMVAASLAAAFLLPRLGYGGERFHEPPLLLMAIMLVGMIRPSKLGIFVLSGATAIVLLNLTLLSGARMALLLWPVMAALLLIIGHVPKQFAFVGLCGLGCLLPLADVAIDHFQIADKLEQSRIGQSLNRFDGADMLKRVADDGSMNNRVLEASDAFYTRYDYHGWLPWIFGSGHGATFEGTTAYYGDRLLPGGDVHHIHFGLVLLYYRYGIPGLLGFTWLLVTAFRQMWLLRNCSRKSPLYHPSLLFTIAVIAYLLSFLLFNELIDPVFSFALAGFLTTRDLAAPVRRRTRLRLVAPALLNRRLSRPLAVAQVQLAARRKR